jgi:hypothetical protein
MGVQALRRGRYTFRTNPDCPGDRHVPCHASFIRGCTCSATLAAQQEWLAAGGYRSQGPRPASRLIPEDPACAARRHNPTHTSWVDGCRCPGAIAAHNRHLIKRAVERDQMRQMAATADTDGCPAAIHGTIRARLVGCTHPEAERKYQDKQNRKSARLAMMRARERQDVRNRWLQWHGPDMAVSSINLWMLVRGFRDSPTLAEQVAAVIILGQRGRDTGRLTTAEIAERIGVSSDQVLKLRSIRAQWRTDRTQRRLAEALYRASRARR